MKADHVIVDFAGPRPPFTYAPENQLPLVCMHCGARYILGLPVSIRMSSLVMLQFAREHRHCKKAPGPPNVSPEPAASPRRGRGASRARPVAKGKP